MTAILMIQQLRKFLESGEAGVFQGQSGDLSVRIDFASTDSMSCAFSVLEVATTAKGAMRERCEALSKRLTYLLEPIQLIECDDELKTAQMRSDPPQVEEDLRRYYELTATTGGLILRRYEKKPAEPRVEVNCVVTKEVAVRLASDLLDAVRD